MTDYVYKSTTGRTVRVKNFSVTVEPGLSFDEPNDYLDALIGTKLVRYDDGVLQTSDPEATVVSKNSALVDKISGLPVKGGGSRFGNRKQRLARAVHYGRQNTFDASSYEILRAPTDWAAGTRFCAGTPMRNPAYPDYYFVFRGIQDLNSSSDFSTAFTTIPAPVPNLNNEYAVIRDNASRAVWFQYPAAKFPVTKRASLMQSNGSTPIVPIAERKYEFEGGPVDASSTAMVMQYFYTWNRPDITTNTTALAANRVKLDAFRYTPGRKAVDSVYGGAGNYYFNYDANTTPQSTTYAWEWVFDCTSSSLSLSIQQAPAIATIGDVLYGANIIIDGVAVDFETMKWPAASVANDQKPGRFTFYFRDARRRRVRVLFQIPYGGAPGSIEGIWCGSDGTITAPNYLYTPWIGAGDSTWSGAAPGPYNGLNSNMAFSIGSALGFGMGVDMGQGGTGDIHPPDGPSRQMNFGSRFRNNLNNGLSAIQGGEDFLMHVVYLSGWDEITTNALFTPEYRRAKYTEFLNLWKIHQPNCVLVFVYKRFDPDVEEMNFMDLTSTTGLAAGDKIANASSNPTIKSIVRAVVGNRVFYTGDMFTTIKSAVLNTPSVGINDPSRWPTTTKSNGFVTGMQVYKGTTLIGTATSAPANRLPLIDSQGRSVNIPSIERPEETVVYNDWRAAISAAGLEDDQYLFVSLANMPKDEINNFSTDYKFVGQGFGDPANPSVTVDSVHNIVAYHNLIGKYVANQIKLAMSAYF